MGTLPCAIGDAKLKHYEKDLKLRQEVASEYSEALKDKDFILPFIDSHATSAWAQYSVRVNNRDALQVKLKEARILAVVHYSMTLHLQECFTYLNYKEGDFSVAEKVSDEIMSLPMNTYLNDSYIREKL